ncbi:hypothetical protein L3X38_031655 [Prunus dulcis]|uniref:Uncharacterized protein n=1 Tax=Prunus dulcis TaxID=3755 RepID=A0AAD4YVU8_PRUDU|nr:hypothetical protein L3X38_031655 [Prunus dulcis]
MVHHFRSIWLETKQRHKPKATHEGKLLKGSNIWPKADFKVDHPKNQRHSSSSALDCSSAVGGQVLFCSSDVVYQK